MRPPAGKQFDLRPVDDGIPVANVKRGRAVALLEPEHGEAVGPVDEVVTSSVLSRLYDSPVQVLRVGDALIVAAASGRPLDLGDCRHV